MKRYVLLIFIAFTLISASCGKKENATSPKGLYLSGTGSFTYNNYTPFKNKPIQVYYHVPISSRPNTPILIVFHGFGRDALESRNDFIARANNYDFIVVVPRFSADDFAGGDSYNLANIFDDGDNPSASTLNKEEEWTFSVIDPLFEEIKKLTGNTRSTYDIFGHSAGAQVAHRFLIFQPDANFNRIVSSASGWYTLPNDQIIFPYGLKSSPAESTNLEPIFSTSYTVIVGKEDKDPDSFSLRHNPEVDVQGINRLERARYFYNESRGIAASKNLILNWQFKGVPNVGHNMSVLAGYAVEQLYK